MSTIITSRPSRVIIHGNRKYYTSVVAERRQKAVRKGVNIEGVDSDTYDKSYSSWKAAIQSQDLSKLYSVKGPFSLKNCISRTLNEFREFPRLYRQVVYDYWHLAKDVSLRVESMEDFRMYDSLGYDFTQVSRDNFQWMVSRRKVDLIRCLLQWSCQEFDGSVQRYVIPDGIDDMNTSILECITECRDISVKSAPVEGGVFEMELY